MKISSDDASPMQRIILVLLIIIAIPIGVNDTVERFGGASNSVIILISLIMAMIILSISLSDEMSFYTVFKVAIIASIFSYLLVELGWLDPDDHWLTIIGAFIMFGVVNHFFDEWKRHLR
tara:strand:+ start:472 stop:831 length:360 start_codon:yes stop_codon:yes gene_type:complete